MWHVFAHQVIYEPHADNIVKIPFFSPSWSAFSWEVWSITSEEEYLWYDDWVPRFSQQKEITLIQRAIHEARTNKTRIHIRGISTRESIDLLREYYAEQGYEDDLAKNYTLSDQEPLTVSISLGHALWCSKDKHFLNTIHHQKKQGNSVPPLRTPADLRTLQQALRMGIIMGVEILPGDELYLIQLLEKQILPLFHIGQMTAFRWGMHGFSGEYHTCSVLPPDFCWKEED